MTNIYWESFAMAWSSIVSNKLRSLLTMLGIIIGVGAVIILVSIGYGVRADIEKNISSLGSNLIIVMPGSYKSPGVRPAAGSMQTLTYKDYLAIKNLPNITKAAPTVRNSYVVVNGNKNWTTSVIGVSDDYMSVRDLTMKSGRIWTSEEFSGRSRVAVLGPTVATQLFGDESPIGKKVRINNDPFTVIGLLDSKGYSSSDQDDRILCPFTTVQERMMGITYVSTIEMTAASSSVMDQAQSDITNLLRARHRLQAGADNDFTVENSQDVLDMMNKTMDTLTLFLASIAAISLIVGGIGIMNIMLVSVTERTREIGIRKALGATFHLIIIQFLIESVTISVAGGLIGIILGVCASKAISAMTTMSTVITTLPVLGSFLFSVLIGLIFGLYPARKAALLNPIDALHYE